MYFGKNTGLEKLMAGKRVAIVGPSPHLIGKNIGSIIDKYDVVCRVNDILPKNHIKDYGSRTDVCFYNCSTVSLLWFRDKMNQNKNVIKNLKAVVCPCLKAKGSDNNWRCWKDKKDFQVVENFKLINEEEVPFYHIGYNNYSFYHDLIGTEPNCGFLSILFLLQHSIEELFVTGFSFYSQGTGYESVYYDKHVTENYRDDNFNPQVGHNQSCQIQFFKTIVLKQFGSILKIDSFLNKVLGVDYKNVLEID